MRSLFFKIFVYFWGLIFLVTLVVVGLLLYREQQSPPVAQRHLAQRAVVEYGREAANTYERHGAQALKDFLSAVRKQHGLSLLLFDEQAAPLIAGKVPFGLRNVAQRALRIGASEFPAHGRRHIMPTVVRGESGRSYAVVAWLPRRPAPQYIIAELTRGLLGWQLLSILVLTALVCFILARSFSMPIRRLRNATHRFASGDLSVRVGSSIKGKNEISALAADFDDMATRIEALVAGQQRLLRDISHELRSPLTRLGIALELARKHAGNAEQEHSLQRIELEGERMNALIGQLLELTRLEHAETATARESVNLRQMLGEIVRDADYEAAERNKEVQLDADECTVSAAPELIARALENVIRNAVHYTAAGTGVEVVLRCSGHQALISVADSGPGVPDAELDKLFIPFYRVGEARERHSGGSGIGLAIARRAIELHSGTIQACNRDSGGLLITMVLPLGA